MQFIFYGLMTGSILAIAALGFALVRQTDGFLNVAHGQYLLIGALLGLTFVNTLGWNIFIAGLAAVVATGAIGVGVAWIVFHPLRDKALLARFFSSIGLAFIIYGVVRATWPPQFNIAVYDIGFGARLEIGDLSITMGELIVMIIAWVSVLALHLFLTYTKLGLWTRATASNRELARTRGVRTGLVFSTVWFIACALAGLAGVLVGVVGAVHTELGWQYILTILAVAVMGGLRSLYGVLAAGVILGFVMDLSALVIPSRYGLAVAFAVIIITLLVRPEGLFAPAGRKEVA